MTAIRSFTRASWTIVTAGVLASACSNSEKIDLVIEQTSVPVIKLPNDLQTIVIERPSFDWRSSDSGIYKTQEEAWYNLLLVRLRERFHAHAPQVAILDRRDVAARKDEGTLIQGQIDAKPGDGQTREFFAQAGMRPRFCVQECQRSEQVERPWHERAAEKGARWLPVFGNFVDYDGKYETIHMWELSVQCDMEMTVTATGRVVLSYGDIKLHRDKTRDGWFSYGAHGRTDMDASQNVVNRLISQHVDECLSVCFPVRRHFEVHLEGASLEAKNAAGLLKQGNNRGAAAMATSAWSKNKKDHAAAFIVGLCAEYDTGLGPQKSIELSRQWYDRAYSEDSDNTVYIGALRRTSMRELAMSRQTSPALSAPGVPQQGNDVQEVPAASTALPAQSTGQKG